MADNTLPLSLTIEVPKYHCGTHGDHPAWVAFYQTGEPTRMYCTRCIEDFMSRQSIGKVVLPEGT